jgi:hypothetical protein
MYFRLIEATLAALVLATMRKETDLVIIVALFNKD